jgi:hypothetical protein
MPDHMTDLGSVFDAHVKHEFVDHDVNARRCGRWSPNPIFSTCLRSQEEMEPAKFEVF